MAGDYGALIHPPMVNFFERRSCKRTLPSWQNTDEQDFDWEAEDRKRRRKLDNSQFYSSVVHQPPSNSGFTINTVPSPAMLPPQPSNTSQVRPDTQADGSLSNLLSSLISQGLISLNKQQQQQVDDSAIGVEFDQARLKVRRESVITALYADLPRQCATCGCRFTTQQEHSRHMDWHLMKNRRLSNRKTKPSPTWFVSADMWVGSGEAVGGAQAVDTVEDGEEDLDVPADDDQTACALCRERFDDYYCHEMDLWMYKGAVYMYAPAGIIPEGIDKVKLGPIVHAKCRSGTPPPKARAL